MTLGAVGWQGVADKQQTLKSMSKHECAVQTRNKMWPDDPWRRPEMRDISHTQLSERYGYTDMERQQTGRDNWPESWVLPAWNSSSCEAEAERAPVLGQPGLCPEFQSSLSYIAIPGHEKRKRR